MQDTRLVIMIGAFLGPESLSFRTLSTGLRTLMAKMSIG